MVFLSELAGEHTSSTIIMSDHNSHCVSTTFSGVNMCFDPSYGEVNLTHSSVNFIPTLWLCFSALNFWFASHREKTWKPHESVSISQFFRFSKLCNPHASFTILLQGLKYKWKVFARISFIGSICSQMYLGSCKMSKISHLIVAFVPTGIKIGVFNVIPLSVISHTLAFHFCFKILNCNLDIC